MTGVVDPEASAALVASEPMLMMTARFARRARAKTPGALVSSPSRSKVSISGCGTVLRSAARIALVAVSNGPRPLLLTTATTLAVAPAGETATSVISAIAMRKRAYRAARADRAIDRI